MIKQICDNPECREDATAFKFGEYGTLYVRQIAEDPPDYYSDRAIDLCPQCAADVLRSITNQWKRGLSDKFTITLADVNRALKAKGIE